MGWCITILAVCTTVLVLAVLFLHARCGMYVEGLKQWKKAEKEADEKISHLKTSYEQLGATLVREQLKRTEDAIRYLDDLAAARKAAQIAVDREKEIARHLEVSHQDEIHSRYLEAVTPSGEKVGWWQELVTIAIDHPQDRLAPHNATAVQLILRTSRLVSELEDQCKQQRKIRSEREERLNKIEELASYPV